MRLHIVDNPPKDQRAHYREVRKRLRPEAGLRKPVKCDVPQTKISWTFGSTTTFGNVVSFDFSPVTIAQIRDAVCVFYNISSVDLSSDRRRKILVYPRHVAMYLAAKFTPWSYERIGQSFGNRDHSTVINACRKIGALLETDERMADEIEILTRKIRP